MNKQVCVPPVLHICPNIQERIKGGGVYQYLSLHDDIKLQWRKVILETKKYGVPWVNSD